VTNKELDFNKFVFGLTSCIRFNLLNGKDYWYILSKKELRVINNSDDKEIVDEPIMKEIYTKALSAIRFEKIKTIFNKKFDYFFEKITCRQTRVKMDKQEMGFRLFKERSNDFCRMLNQYRENYIKIDNSLIYLEIELLEKYKLDVDRVQPKAKIVFDGDVEKFSKEIDEKIEKRIMEVYRKTAILEKPIFESNKRVKGKLFSLADEFEKFQIKASKEIEELTSQRVKSHNENLKIVGKIQMLDDKCNGLIQGLNNFEKKVERLLERVLDNDSEVKIIKNGLNTLTSKILEIKKDVNKLFKKSLFDSNLSVKARVEKEFDFSQFEGEDAELLNIVCEKHNLK
jgi:hypothetical protein